MRRLALLFANLAWMAATLPGWLRFAIALRIPRLTQARIRRRLLRASARTAWGRGRDLTRLTPTSFEDYRDAVTRILGGEPGVLTAEAVRLLEPTSGSTAAPKLVPYTASLQREFRAAVDPWVFSLYLSRPRLLFARHYWSVSPATPDAAPAARVPVGFAADSEYLGFFQRRLARTLFVVPPQVRLIPDADAFRFATATLLAAAPDLGLVSVWHPSFLEVLLGTIESRRDEIADAIGSGRLPEGLAVPPVARAAVARRLRPDPSRAALISSLGPGEAHRLWPNLEAISCWSTGRAAAGAAGLGARFPGVLVQGKGLIATEGVVTIPWGKAHAAAVRSHCLEFSDRRTGAILPLHALRTGERYQVLLTTGGGFVRYALGDEVRCTGFAGSTPTLAFIGRTGGVVDLAGEKLAPAHAEAAIAAAEGGRPFRFAMLAPDPDGRGYTLYLEDDHGRDAARVAGQVERHLLGNYHYRHARRMAQLRPLGHRAVRNAAERYLAAHATGGTKLGAVKAVALHPDSTWDSLFEAGTGGDRPCGKPASAACGARRG